VNAVLSSSALRAVRSTYATRIGLITGVALVARVLFLDHQPLWRDEAFTSIVVQMPIGQMLDAVRMDSAPPLSYLLQHFIAPLWPGPAGLRLLSVGAGAASARSWSRWRRPSFSPPATRACMRWPPPWSLPRRC
jgi:hypothetical protein